MFQKKYNRFNKKYYKKKFIRKAGNFNKNVNAYMPVNRKLNLY